jgi:hypothetical protein
LLLLWGSLPIFRWIRPCFRMCCQKATRKLFVPVFVRRYSNETTCPVCMLPGRDTSQYIPRQRPLLRRIVRSISGCSSRSGCETKVIPHRFVFSDTGARTVSTQSVRPIHVSSRNPELPSVWRRIDGLKRLRSIWLCGLRSDNFAKNLVVTIWSGQGSYLLAITGRFASLYGIAMLELRLPQ